MFEDIGANLTIFQQFKQIISINLLIQLSMFVIGLIISGIGLFHLFRENSQEIELTTDESSQVCSKDPEFGKITVDVGGAIENPGIYELQSGSRINDLINLAGGFSETVDKFHINKILNMASLLSDGEKIYIPTIEESIENQNKNSLKNQSDEGNQTATNDLTNLVSINSGSKSELEGLTGIGEKRAEDIIAARPYESINQLVDKEVLTVSVFEKIKSSISI
ncbi:MAG: helix-hairpin-helix domain-containing protein [Pseudomonadales bacterium]|nr:helix-hairpin-helix domain-containing protein [Pseudomonadales bacterium]